MKKKRIIQEKNIKFLKKNKLIYISQLNNINFVPDKLEVSFFFIPPKKHLYLNYAA